MYVCTRSIHWHYNDVRFLLIKMFLSCRIKFDAFSEKNTTSKPFDSFIPSYHITAHCIKLLLFLLSGNTLSICNTVNGLCNICHIIFVEPSETYASVTGEENEML